MTTETAALRDRGVLVLIAHHWDRPEGPAFDLRLFFEELCGGRFQCLALDDSLGSQPGTTVQADGHWTAAGHRVVAEALRGVLDPHPAAPLSLIHI